MPESLWQCNALTELNLSYTLISEVAGSARHLTRLAWLELSATKLTACPAVLAELRQLTHLAAVGLDWAALPADLTCLTDLRTLLLRFNKLDAWLSTDAAAPVFGSLTQLAMLDLAANALTQLPLHVVRSPSLLHLNLTDNKIVELSTEVRARLAGVRFVCLADNPVAAPTPLSPFPLPLSESYGITCKGVFAYARACVCALC